MPATPLFQKVDAVTIPVPDLDAGLLVRSAGRKFEKLPHGGVTFPIWEKPGYDRRYFGVAPY
jgi:hypothetical protein